MQMFHATIFALLYFTTICSTFEQEQQRHQVGISSDNNIGEGGDMKDFDCARLPPAFWCSCEKVQAKCGFDRFCSMYERTNRGKILLLTLLYESLCPDCQYFMGTQLEKAYHSFQGYVQYELVPFGNARIDENGTIICQHGEPECNANRFESCALHIIPDPLPFIFCLERLLSNQLPLEKASRKCYASLHIGPHVYDQVHHCYNGALGQKLQIAAANRTINIWPDQHEFVPWLMINNASLESAQSAMLTNLAGVLCQSLIPEHGKDLPPICHSQFKTPSIHRKDHLLFGQQIHPQKRSSSSSSSNDSSSSSEAKSRKIRDQEADDDRPSSMEEATAM